jgi:penicillin-binding protein 2
MDPNNGHVLALASYPGYDLNVWRGGISAANYKILQRDGALNDYAISGLYTPGSTFKMVSATAQLQTGIFPAGRYVNDTGTYKVPGCLQGYHGCLFHDDETGGSGQINLPMALTRSSDYYFYNLGYLFWSQTGRYGKTPIQDVASKYGLDQPSLIDLPNEAVGRVDSPTVRLALHNAAPKAFPNYQWYTGDNLQMAFGQGSTAVTPIEMLNAYATLANGGTRYAPEVVAAVTSPKGKPVVVYGPKVEGHVNLPPSVRGPIVDGLTGVVSSPYGTGYAAFQQYAHFSLASFPIAGKTGTASNCSVRNRTPGSSASDRPTRPSTWSCASSARAAHGASASAPVVAQTFDYLVHHPLAPLNVSATTATKSQLHPANG